MYEIKKVDVLSMAKISTFIVGGSYILWGILFSGALFVFSGFYYEDVFGYGGFPFFTILGGVIASIVIGFGIGALGAFIYNLVASWIGGIKIDIEMVSEDTSTNNPQQN